MASKGHPAIIILLGVAAVVGGGYLYYSGLQATGNADEVEATVISSNVGEVGSSTGSDSYTISVRYRYTYDGETYTSWSMCPGAGSACVPTSDSRSDMQETLEDYPEGGTVTAYISPSDPSEAYLIDTDPSPIYLGVSAFGMVFVLLGVRELRTGTE
jgi:hypothetical protein